MADRTTEDGTGSTASLIESTRSSLEPLMVTVIEALADDGGTGSFFAAGAFVQDLLDRLRSITGETDLLALLLDISLIDFQGFEFSAAGKQTVDALLVECESIVRALTAADR